MRLRPPVSAQIIGDADRDGLLAAFTRAYQRRYGRSENMPVEILSWRLAVEGPRSALGESLVARKIDGTADGQPVGSRQAWFDDHFIETPVYRRADLAPGTEIKGPAIIEETESTTILPPEFDLSIDRALNLVLTREKR